MWLAGGLLAAAEAPANDSLIVVVGGIVVAAIGALGLVLTEVVRGRPGRVGEQPTADLHSLAIDVAVLKDWRIATREADDIHDRAVFKVIDDVGDIVRWLDREFPRWRP